MYIGEVLLQRKAIVLPAAHDFFSEKCNEILATVDQQETVTKMTVKSLWVLRTLTSVLQHHLLYSCEARQYGTILYRPNTDIVPHLQ